MEELAAFPVEDGQWIVSLMGAAGEHPPTGAMNREAASGPASSEDAQRQMQGRPTAAQQAEGAKPNDC